jgi:hypothetical protein
MKECSTTLKGGTGKSEIVLSKEFFPEGLFVGFCDPLHVRILLLESEIKIAIVSIELTSIEREDVVDFKKIVLENTGVDICNIWICATHSFSSPHIKPERLLRNNREREQNEVLIKAVVEAIRKASFQAVNSLCQVTIGMGSGYCDINVNRDVETHAGWWIGINPEGVSDKTLTVLKVTEGGKVKAVLFHYAVQSSIMDGSEIKGGGALVTPDLAGKSANFIEEYYGDPVVALFVVGAAGDQVPIWKAVTEIITPDGERNRMDAGEGGFTRVNELGEEMGRKVCLIADSLSDSISAVDMRVNKIIVMTPRQKKTVRNPHDMKPVKIFNYEDDGEGETEIEILMIGELIIVGITAEINCITMKSIQDGIPEKRIIVATMVNGASKYMADAESYCRFTYEARNSFYGKGAAEIFVKNSIEAVKKLSEEYKFV